MHDTHDAAEGGLRARGHIDAKNREHEQRRPDAWRDPWPDPGPDSGPDSEIENCLGHCLSLSRDDSTKVGFADFLGIHARCWEASIQVIKKLWAGDKGTVKSGGKETIACNKNTDKIGCSLYISRRL
jgi:hypothetical protein